MEGDTLGKFGTGPMCNISAVGLMSVGGFLPNENECLQLSSTASESYPTTEKY